MSDLFEKYNNEQKKKVGISIAIRDYGMGIILTVLGLFFLLRSFVDIPFNKSYPPDSLDIVIGIMFTLYGAWRIYRGYKKNYFK